MRRHTAISLSLTVALLTLTHASSVRAQEQTGSETRTLRITNSCAFPIWVGVSNPKLPKPPSEKNGWKLDEDTSTSITVPLPWISGSVWARTECDFGVPPGQTCAPISNKSCPPGTGCYNGLCIPTCTDVFSPTECQEKLKSESAICHNFTHPGQCSAGECGCINNPACETGDCLGAASCTVSQFPPASLAEFTFHADGTDDSYDVSLAAGANIPVQITPVPGTFTPRPPPGIGTACTNNADCIKRTGLSELRCDNGKCVAPFECGSPGCTGEGCAGFGQPDGLDSCLWDFDGESTTTTFAVAEEDCPEALQAIVKGKYVGCLSADKACANRPPNIPPTSPSSLNCATNLDLYACTGSNAANCFNKNDPNCCGCPDWAKNLVPPDERSLICPGDNPKWHQIAEPLATQFNTICPTAYSFPDDDQLKTFKCRGEKVVYAITFCPDVSVFACPNARPTAGCTVNGVRNQLCQGTDGADIIVGTRGSDTIVGLGGDDKLQGRKGDDLLCGGPGDDRLDGGRGDDVLEGGADHDRLFGQRGEDILRGGAGEDQLRGGPHDDELDGGEHEDRLAGGRGEDVCVNGERLSGCEDDGEEEPGRAMKRRGHGYGWSY